MCVFLFSFIVVLCFITGAGYVFRDHAFAWRYDNQRLTAVISNKICSLLLARHTLVNSNETPFDRDLGSLHTSINCLSTTFPSAISVRRTLNWKSMQTFMKEKLWCMKCSSLNISCAISNSKGCFKPKKITPWKKVKDSWHWPVFPSWCWQKRTQHWEFGVPPLQNCSSLTDCCSLARCIHRIPAQKTCNWIVK